MKRNEDIQVLRGIAVSLVVLFHPGTAGRGSKAAQSQAGLPGDEGSWPRRRHAGDPGRRHYERKLQMKARRGRAADGFEASDADMVRGRAVFALDACP